MKEIALAPLPYADDALAPTVSAKTISFHYGKHHAGYVKTRNGLIAGTKYEGLSLGEIVAASRDAGDTAIFNNAAQIWGDRRRISRRGRYGNLQQRGADLEPRLLLAVARARREGRRAVGGTSRGD